MRWLLVVVIFAILYYLFLRKPLGRWRNKTNTDTFTQNNSTQNDKTQITETLCECKKCGTFVAPSDAFIKDGNYYCSKECAYN